MRPARSHPARLAAALLAALLCAPLSLAAAVFDVTVANVTTRAFSVVWVSDEPVSDATVRVFSDADGTEELTDELDVVLTSGQFAPALDQGIVKVDVTGLAAGATVYVQTETTGASGVVLWPEAPPLLEVQTAQETRKADEADQAIVNDLVMHEMLAPDGVTPADGTLLLVQAPGVAAYPLAVFAGDGYPSPVAVADLNNLFAKDTLTSAVIPSGTPLAVTEFRGLLCEAVHQKLARWRRAPVHEETPPITALEGAAPCFSPEGVGGDFNCDGRVNPVDFNELLIRFGLSNPADAPDCRFHPDFDLNLDQSIDPLDFNAFLTVYGASE